MFKFTSKHLVSFLPSSFLFFLQIFVLFVGNILSLEVFVCLIWVIATDVSYVTVNIWSFIWAAFRETWWAQSLGMSLLLFGFDPQPPWARVLLVVWQHHLLGLEDRMTWRSAGGLLVESEFDIVFRGVGCVLWKWFSVVWDQQLVPIQLSGKPTFDSFRACSLKKMWDSTGTQW